MVYAQIKDGIIKNMIVLEDESIKHLFSEGFDHFVRVDELNPVPCIGWAYDGVFFTKPEGT
jgi:hypothetical protein